MKADKYLYYIRSDRPDADLLEEIANVDFEIGDGDCDIRHVIFGQQLPTNAPKLASIFVEFARNVQLPSHGARQAHDLHYSISICQPSSFPEKCDIHFYDEYMDPRFSIMFMSKSGGFDEYLPSNPSDDLMTGAAATRGELLLHDNMPMCISNIAVFSAEINGSDLRIIRHKLVSSSLGHRGLVWKNILWREFSLAAGAEAIKDGVRFLSKLRMLAAEFRESVSAAIGDPSRYDRVAPYEWTRDEHSYLKFSEAACSLSCLSETDVDVKPMISHRDFELYTTVVFPHVHHETFCTNAYRCLTPFPFAKVPLAHLGFTPSDITNMLREVSSTESYLPPAYVPDNFAIVLDTGSDQSTSLEQQERALAGVLFMKNVVLLLGEKVPYKETLVGLIARYEPYSLKIYGYVLRANKRKDFLIKRKLADFCLEKDSGTFDRALHALYQACKMAATIQGALCTALLSSRNKVAPGITQLDCEGTLQGEDMEMGGVNEAVSNIDLGTGGVAGGCVPMNAEEASLTSRRCQKRGRDEDENEDEAILPTVKHRRVGDGHGPH